MPFKRKKFHLKKELSLLDLVFYGVGVILGAGIYSLIGEATAIAGTGVWISFAASAIIAAFTGFSFAELSSLYAENAAEFVYTKKAFNRRWLAFIVQWIFIFAELVAIAVISLGFGRYFSFVTGIDPVISAVALIALFSIVNYIGIKESANYNRISTSLEIIGLLIVVAAGGFFISTHGSAVDFFDFSGIGVNAVMAAVALIFFAYLGFEDIVNITEEAKQSRKDIPKALLISLFASTILYILVSFSALGVLGSDALSHSKAPLIEVVASVFPSAKIIISLISIFAISNGVLILLLVVSRTIYGLAKNKMLPRFFSDVGKHNTPQYAILATAALSIAALSIGGISVIAKLSDLGLFLIYFAVNCSVIVLRFKEPHLKREFKSPVNIGKIPVLAVLGALSSLAMLQYFNMQELEFELGLIFAGLIIYAIFNRNKG